MNGIDLSANMHAQENPDVLKNGRARAALANNASHQTDLVLLAHDVGDVELRALGHLHAPAHVAHPEAHGLARHDVHAAMRPMGWGMAGLSE